MKPTTAHEIYTKHLELDEARTAARATAVEAIAAHFTSTPTGSRRAIADTAGIKFTTFAHLYTQARPLIKTTGVEVDDKTRLAHHDQAVKAVKDYFTAKEAANKARKKYHQMLVKVATTEGVNLSKFSAASQVPYSAFMLARTYADTPDAVDANLYPITSETYDTYLQAADKSTVDWSSAQAEIESVLSKARKAAHAATVKRDKLADEARIITKTWQQLANEGKLDEPRVGLPTLATQVGISYETLRDFVAVEPTEYTAPSGNPTLKEVTHSLKRFNSARQQMRAARERTRELVQALAPVLGDRDIPVSIVSAARASGIAKETVSGLIRRV